MNRFRYSDCPGGTGCPARHGGRGMCCYCQPGSPFALRPDTGWAGFDRLRLGRL